MPVWSRSTRTGKAGADEYWGVVGSVDKGQGAEPSRPGRYLKDLYSAGQGHLWRILSKGECDLAF